MKNPKPLTGGRLRAWQREQREAEERKTRVTDRSPIITRQQIRQMERKRGKMVSG